MQAITAPELLPEGQRHHTTQTGIRLGCAHVRTARQAQAIEGPYRRQSLADRAVCWACAAGALFVIGLLLAERLA